MSATRRILIIGVASLLPLVASCSLDGASSGTTTSSSTTSPSSTTSSTSTTKTSSTSPSSSSPSPTPTAGGEPDVEVHPEADTPPAHLFAPVDPAVAPAPEPPAPAPAPAPESVYFGSCADAKAAGAAPLYAGNPGYSSKLDRDGDGVACEK
nr:excalibur calcium-binding domain-containing protein [Corynebacterium lactis]